MKLSWEWIGGFFEGEGCVTWYAGEEGHRGRGAVISIGQKEKEPLKQIATFLAQEGFRGVRLYWRKPYPSKWRGKINGCWMLQLTRKGENQWFLREIIPHLIAKRNKAESILSKTAAQRSGTLTVRDISHVVQLWDDGKSGQIIAKQTGIGHHRVLRVLKASGRDTSRRPKEMKKIPLSAPAL